MSQWGKKENLFRANHRHREKAVCVGAILSCSGSRVKGARREHRSDRSDWGAGVKIRSGKPLFLRHRAIRTARDLREGMSGP